MALIHLDFESQYCGCNQDVYIIVPDKKRGQTPEEFYQKDKKYKVLWLLHGTFGGYSDWIRKSNIETYACEKDLMVVMPGIGNTDYEPWTNFTLGYDSCKYIIEELMPLVYAWLPASDKQEDNFISGLSMGGGGAMKLAINYPEKFAKAAILSSAPRDLDGNRAELEEIFNMKRSDFLNQRDTRGNNRSLRTYNQMHRYDTLDEYLDSVSNIWRTVDRIVAEGGKIPPMFYSIGTEDQGYERWLKWKAHAEELGLDAEFHTGPGVHEWRVWERDIQRAITYFGLDDDEVKGNVF